MPTTQRGGGAESSPKKEKIVIIHANKDAEPIIHSASFHRGPYHLRHVPLSAARGGGRGRGIEINKHTNISQRERV